MKTKLILLFLGAGLILASCTKYPPASDRLLEDLAIYTKVDLTVNFENYKTFAIVPAIAYIDGKDSSTLTNANAMALINRVALDMTGRGFKQVANTAHPDFGINVTAIKNTNTSVYYPGWYWGYPGYYPPNWWGYPGYGYGYPYYPTYVTTYSTGTVIIDMVDFKNPTPDNKLMIRWNAYIRGLLTDTHTQADILKCVDQSFTQSPQIKTTPL